MWRTVGANLALLLLFACSTPRSAGEAAPALDSVLPMTTAASASALVPGNGRLRLVEFWASW